jgi:hypothetical protein
VIDDIETTRRFIRKIKVNEETGCWEWSAALHGGYGWFNLGGKVRRSDYAHRLAYDLFVGPLTPGLYVCHKCDNRKCVSPEHMYLGTPKDNSHDAINRNRFPDLRGSRRGPKSVLRRRLVAGRDRVEVRPQFGECVSNRKAGH